MSNVHFLKLSDRPIRFSPLNKTTRVFYDPANKQIFSVHADGEIGIIVQNILTKDTFEFRLKDSGPIVCIKLSLDQTIIAIQRTKSALEFYNYQQTAPCFLLVNEYMKNCKRNSIILGFLWTGINEILFVTNHGLELYKIDPNKKTFSMLKTFSQTCDWFLWCPQCSLVILASAHGVNLVPILIRTSSFSKLTRLDVEQTRIIVERDVTLTQVYGRATVLILKHQNIKYDQIIVYVMNENGDNFVKSHVLNLSYSGKFGINVVDNLIVVHHQREKRSLLFDINLQGSSDKFVTYHTLFVEDKEIEPFDLEISCLSQPSKQKCDLYTIHWVILQPNIIMDTKLGCLWNLELNLSSICQNIKNLRITVDLLLSRANGKQILLQELSKYFEKPGLKLDVLQPVFDSINVAYRLWLDNNLKTQLALSVNYIKTEKMKNPTVILTQIEMFEKSLDKCPFDIKDSVIIEYVRALLKHGIPVDTHISDELIRILVVKNKIINLLQLIQYRVLKDSTQLAYTLLAYGESLPVINQLAIDMLVRLNATTEIQDYFLNKGEVVLALQLANNENKELSFEKYLVSAKNVGDIAVYRVVLNYFKSNPKYKDKIDEIEKFSIDLFSIKTENFNEYSKTNESLNLLHL